MLKQKLIGRFLQFNPDFLSNFSKETADVFRLKNDGKRIVENNRIKLEDSELMVSPARLAENWAIPKTSEHTTPKLSKPSHLVKRSPKEIITQNEEVANTNTELTTSYSAMFRSLTDKLDKASPDKAQHITEHIEEPKEIKASKLKQIDMNINNTDKSNTPSIISLFDYGMKYEGNEIAKIRKKVCRKLYNILHDEFGLEKDLAKRFSLNVEFKVNLFYDHEAQASKYIEKFKALLRLLKKDQSSKSKVAAIQKMSTEDFSSFIQNI